MGILAEEDGWFFNDGNMTRHKSLALPLNGRSSHLLCFSLYPNSWLWCNFGLFWGTIGLHRRFSLHGQVSLTPNLRRQATFLFLLRNSLLLYKDPSPAFLHFCMKMDGWKELSNLLKIKKKQVWGNGLTCAYSFVIATGSLGWFRTVIVPVECIQGY